MTENLINEFKELDDTDKIAFLHRLMPEVCAMFRNNPQLMTEMMPQCRQMMQDWGMDMEKMMGMMQMMNQKKE